MASIWTLGEITPIFIVYLNSFILPRSFVWKENQKMNEISKRFYYLCFLISRICRYTRIFLYDCVQQESFPISPPIQVLRTLVGFNTKRVLLTHSHWLFLRLYLIQFSLYVYHSYFWEIKVKFLEVQGLFNEFPNFFRMGTFIDSTHMKLLSPSK